VAQGILEKANSNVANWGSYPMYGARLSEFMHLSGPSNVCLRRGQCDPLGGKSVWSSIGGKVNQTQDIILVVAHLDATALFHDNAIGADATVSSKVAAIVAAQAVAKAQLNGTFNKQVIFALFDGESWGFMGSKRFVRDVISFKCNQALGDVGQCLSPYTTTTAFTQINFQKISAIVEVGMVGNLAGNSLYVHTDETKAPGSSTISQAVVTAGQQIGVTVNDVASSRPGAEYPPSSLMSFLLNKTIPAVLIAEHSAQYTNRYFGSHLDDARNINWQSVNTAAQLIATTVVNLATGLNTANITVNSNLTQHLVVCFTSNFSCDLSQVYLPGISTVNPTAYVGVWNYAASSAQTKLAHDVLFEVTTSNVTNVTCEGLSDCYALGGDCVRGVCMVGETHYHEALSVGLDFNYNGGSGFIFNDAWGKQGDTWTESRWLTTTVELFVVDNPTSEVITLVAGVIVCLASFAATWAIKSNLFKLFKSV